MRDGDGLRVRQILTGACVRDPRRLQPIEGRTRDRRLVAEVFELKHLLGMRARDRNEPLVPCEDRESRFAALLVHEVEELTLRYGIGLEGEIVRKIEPLGLVFADLRNKERRTAELTGERRDLRLDGGDLLADDPPAAARLDRGLELAGDRQRLDREDRHGD